MEAFARTGEAIRATNSKLEKTRLLGEYFASLDEAILPLAAVYFAARPFADRDQRKLNLGYAVIRNAVCELARVNEEALGESYMRHSDVGDVIEEVLQGHTHPRPTALGEVHETFVRIYEQRTVKKKTEALRELLKEGDRVVLYSRDLNEVTAAFPEVVAAAEVVPHDVLLDGELLAFKDGLVRPFFELQHRLGRKVVSAQLLAEVPVIFVAFDVLYLDGRNLLTEPLRERRRLLDELDLPSPFMLAYLIRANNAEELDRIFDAARARNNEGLMVKDPASKYTPGRRGLGWLKLKKALATLDVVVTGVEVGHGKRKNVLSDYTFAVYDEQADRLVNIGKAYSGLTDVEIAQMTDYFKSITLKDYGRFRLVQPEVVLEVAFDAIMESGRHNSGYALRFPRIKQIRRDKTIREIDTLANVAKMHRAFTGERVQLVESAQG